MDSAALSTVPPLTSLKVSNGALAAKDLPARLKILAWGKNESTRGDVILDETSVASLNANQRALGYDRVAIDFEHSTVPGSPEFERGSEPRKVGGYGTPEVVAGDGLYLGSVEWTPAGTEFARNYADLSPALGLDKSGRVIFIHSAALTRNGAIHDLSFFSANANPPNQNMKAPQLAEALGLPLETTEAEVFAKLKTFFANLAPLLALVKEGKLVALSAAGDAALLGRIETLESAQTERDRSALLAEAVRAGKVVPLTAEQAATMPLATLRALVEKLPAQIVPFHARGRVNETAPAPDRGAQQKAAIAAYRVAHNCDFDAAFNAIQATQPALFA